MIATSHKKRVLITGSASGIGRNAVRTLADRGHKICATTLTEAQAALWKAERPDVDAFKLDITDASDRSHASDLEIDVLVNNAALGMMTSTPPPPGAAR